MKFFSLLGVFYDKLVSNDDGVAESSTFPTGVAYLPLRLLPNAD